MPDKNQGECRESFHNWHWTTRAVNPIKKFVKGRWIWLVPEEDGKPDIVVQHGIYGAHVEIKNGDTSFPFNEWRPAQREWAEKYGSLHNLWFWLGLGTDPPHYDPEEYCPRAAFLFPYWVMFLCEEKLLPYQKSLPYRARGSLIVIQEQRLYAEYLLQRYRLTWANGGWHLPESHSFPMQPLPDFNRLLKETSNGSRISPSQGESLIPA